MEGQQNNGIVDLKVSKGVLISFALAVLFLMGTVQALQLTGMYKTVNANQQVLNDIKGVSVGTVSATAAPVQNSAPTASAPVTSRVPQQVGGC